METQSSICAWADETFGQAPSVIRVLVRAQEEFTEALRAATATGDEKSIGEEIADTMIVLARALRLYHREVSLTYSQFNPFLGEEETGPRPGLLEAMAVTGLRLGKAILYESQQRSDHAAGEAVTAWRYLIALQKVLGLDAQMQIDKKMNVNRGRTWRVEPGTGHGYHVRHKEDVVEASR